MITINGKKVLYTNDKVKAQSTAIKAYEGKVLSSKEASEILVILGITDETGKVKAIK